MAPKELTRRQGGADRRPPPVAGGGDAASGYAVRVEAVLPAYAHAHTRSETEPRSPSRLSRYRET